MLDALGYNMSGLPSGKGPCQSESSLSGELISLMSSSFVNPILIYSLEKTDKNSTNRFGLTFAIVTNLLNQLSSKKKMKRPNMINEPNSQGRPVRCMMVEDTKLSTHLTHTKAFSQTSSFNKKKAWERVNFHLTYQALCHYGYEDDLKAKFTKLEIRLRSENQNQPELEILFDDMSALPTFTTDTAKQLLSQHRKKTSSPLHRFIMRKGNQIELEYLGCKYQLNGDLSEQLFKDTTNGTARGHAVLSYAALAMLGYGPDIHTNLGFTSDEMYHAIYEVMSKNITFQPDPVQPVIRCFPRPAAHQPFDYSKVTTDAANSTLEKSQLSDYTNAVISQASAAADTNGAVNTGTAVAVNTPVDDLNPATSTTAATVIIDPAVGAHGSVTSMATLSKGQRQRLKRKLKKAEDEEERLVKLQKVHETENPWLS